MIAISLTIYSHHLGFSARSPKNVSKRVPGPLGWGAQNVRKEAKTGLQTEKLEKQLIFNDFLTIWAPRGR